MRSFLDAITFRYECVIEFFRTTSWLGAKPEDLTFVQISLRGAIVFIATLIMIRLGHKRSLSRKTAFDAVLLVILASVLSRAINGSAPFFATLGGGWCWCCSIGFSLLSPITPIGSAL